jgi:hypothetical protein
MVWLGFLLACLAVLRVFENSMLRKCEPKGDIVVWVISALDKKL